MHDADADRSIAPLVGRLAAFDSGADNVHSVEPLRRGVRFVLAMWFSRKLGMAEGAARPVLPAPAELQREAGVAACSCASLGAGLVSAAEVSLPGNDPLREELLSSAASRAVVVSRLGPAAARPAPTLPAGWAELPVAQCKDGECTATAPSESSALVRDLARRQEALTMALRALRRSRLMAYVALQPLPVADPSVADAFSLFDD